MNIWRADYHFTLYDVQHQGFLLRFHFIPQDYLKVGLLLEQNILPSIVTKPQDEAFVGFSTLQPWVSLGDPTLLECLKMLEGQVWSAALVGQTLVHAWVDGVLRLHNQNAFQHQVPVINHFFGGVLSGMVAACDMALDQQLDTVKFKVPGNTLSSTIQFIQLLEIFGKNYSKALKLRLDFQNQWTVEAFVSLLKVLKEKKLLGVVDFFEDPFTIEEPALFAETIERLQSQYGIAIALDFFDENTFLFKYQVPKLIVLKPVAQPTKNIVDICKKYAIDCVVTSYMDHPFGQLTAAWHASMIRQEIPLQFKKCGLMTHNVVKLDWQSWLMQQGQDAILPLGVTGFGADHSLQRLTWERVR